jgi:hypothetical protein
MPSMPTRLRHRRAIGNWAITCLALIGSVLAQTFSYLGQHIMPSGALLSDTTVGGLSGID